MTSLKHLILRLAVQMPKRKNSIRQLFSKNVIFSVGQRRQRLWGYLQCGQ